MGTADPSRQCLTGDSIILQQDSKNYLKKNVAAGILCFQLNQHSRSLGDATESFGDSHLKIYKTNPWNTTDLSGRFIAAKGCFFMRVKCNMQI